MQQYDLAGNLVDDVSTSTPVEAPAPVRPAVQLSLGVRELVPTVARSARWRGLVVSESLDMVLASSPSTEGPAQVLDDHGRPGYLGPLGPHHCPGLKSCPHRWLSDDELEG